MKKQILLVAALGVLTLPALADGFYVTADVGQGKIESDAGNGFTVSKTDTSYSIGAGYDFNKFVGVEVAYRDLGTIRDRGTDSDEAGSYSWTDKVNATAFQASVIGKLPVSDVVNVYGRVGIAKLDVDQTIRINNQSSFSYDDSTTKGLLGIGVSYDITPEIALRAEYNQYAKWDDTKLSALTVGATYHF
jgi:opacity protein-like surface antigen